MIKQLIPGVSDFYEEVGHTLSGMPDFVLSLLILVFALGVGIAAVKAPPQWKPLILAWVIL